MDANQEQTEAPPTIRLILDFDPEKQQIQVNGPIHNRMLCYGMLKLAEKAIDEFAEKQKPKIHVPAHDDLNGHRFRL